MSRKLREAIRTVNRALVAGGSLAALAMGSHSTLAQQGAEPVNEIIEVVGIRASLRQSLDVKRSSDSIVDAISSEDIGKFPDKNVAESLQRVPGVTIQRQFGEGAAVSIRGAGQDLTLTTLNGQNVASTGWFVLEPARRSFNYELLPSELVGSVEVYKSSQADLAEGGVGGTVVVNTRKPLDLDALSLFGAIEGQYQSDSEETDPQYSGLVSWKNEAENFGVLVSAVAQERSLQRQGNEAFWAWGAGPVAFEQQRERSAFAATFQYRPTEALDIVFNAIDMEMEADNTNYALWLTRGSGGDTERVDGTPVSGPLNVAFYQARPREATMNSEVFDLTLNYAGDGYDLKLQIGETNSTGGTDFEMVVNDGLAPDISQGSYDFSGSGQRWNIPGFDLGAYDPGVLEMGVGPAFNRTPKTDDEEYIQADIEFDTDIGLIKSIKTGLKYADHNSTSRRFEYIQADDFDPFIATEGITRGTIDAGAGNFRILQLDTDAVKAWAKSSIVGQTEDLGSYSEIDEENLAAYVMATYEGDGFRGNIGIRYVTTDATSTYFFEGVRTETGADYSEVLPSFNLVFDLTDDTIFRASAARVLARPQYVDMYVNPNVVGTNDELPDNQFWIVGNIGLQPFTADQFDMGIEWYFDEGSLLSFGFFTKNVKNFVTIDQSEAGADEIPFPLPPEEAAFGWTVQEKNNGRSATIEGFELQYQQDFGNGFGGIFNYTYTDTETDRDTFTDGNPFLSDSSKDSFNVTGYYESSLFQVRLAYSWRSEYMLRESGSYGNRLHDDFGTLDVSASWSVTDNIDITFDANNLLEEDVKQFGNDVVARDDSGFNRGFPLYEYEMARRISLGVAFKY